MKKLALTFAIILTFLLTACTNITDELPSDSNTVSVESSNDSTSEITEFAKSKLVQNKYENECTVNTNDYSSYITYEIDNHMNYIENTEIVDTYLESTKIYIRHLKIHVNVNNDINIKEIKWYEVKNNELVRCSTPFYFDDILSHVEKTNLSDELGKKLYADEFEVYDEKTAALSYCTIDMDNDGEDDYLSYVTAPWIQGKDYNITLQLNISDKADSIKLDKSIFLNPSSMQLSFVNVNIMNTKTNGIYDIMVETISRDNGTCTREILSFDGTEYKLVL